MFEWMQRQSHQTLHVMLIQWIKQVLHRCIGFQVSGMAEGDWRLPRQFAGLIGRSDTELELRPFECLEIEGGMDELPPCLPKSRGWVVATENYEDLEELNRVWHYVDRAMPHERGMRAYAHFKTIDGLLWYKPCLRHEDMRERPADVLFRKVPGDLVLTLEMSLGSEEWDMQLFSSFSGNKLLSMKYHRVEKVTWKSLYLRIRHQLLDLGSISGAQSFKLIYQNREPNSMQGLVFKPYKYDEVEAPEPVAKPKAKAKSAPKAKSVLKRPASKGASAKSVLKRPGRK